MKTVSRMVFRYITMAFATVVLVLFVNLAIFLGLVVDFGIKYQNSYFPIGQLAESFTQAPDGSLSPVQDLNWQATFEWAMVLDNSGEVIWSENLPQELNHPYTVPQVAAFSRWYLEDYPVLVYRNDFGLLVAARPKGSMTRFDFYMETPILEALLRGFVPLLLLDGALVLLVCLLLGWRGARPLRQAAQGIDSLARGEPVALEETGPAAELAQRLNRTSLLLQQQAQQIAQRDTARTNWIAGVSHDIRTPLSLILGYAEQLQASPEPAVREKASVICGQSQKIRSLIEDLNLTSKLEYNAHPLRLESVRPGRLLRQCAAAFSEALGSTFALTLTVEPSAEAAQFPADPALLCRAVDNLLLNAQRHNPQGCHIALRAWADDAQLHLLVQDTGSGYSPQVLQSLQGETLENPPHILGLSLVQQIVKSHHGEVRFWNDQGAAAQIDLPLSGPN